MIKNEDTKNTIYFRFRAVNCPVGAFFLCILLLKISCVA